MSIASTSRAEYSVCFYTGLARRRLTVLGDTYTCSASDALIRWDTEFTRQIAYDIRGLLSLLRFILLFFETIGWM